MLYWSRPPVGTCTRGCNAQSPRCATHSSWRTAATSPARGAPKKKPPGIQGLSWTQRPRAALSGLLDPHLAPAVLGHELAGEDVAGTPGPGTARLRAGAAHLAGGEAGEFLDVDRLCALVVTESLRGWIRRAQVRRIGARHAHAPRRDRGAHHDGDSLQCVTT